MIAMDALDIDTAVASAAMFQMSPPAIERPFFDVRESAAELQAKMAATERRAREQFQEWLEQSDTHIRTMEATLAHNPVLPHHLEGLRILALAIEKEAEQHVVEVRRRDKRLRKLLKEVEAVSKPAGVVVDAALRNLFAFAHQESEARLEAALAFRALRSRHLPDNDTGIEISDPGDVDRLLREAMATV